MKLNRTTQVFILFAQSHQLNCCCANHGQEACHLQERGFTQTGGKVNLESDFLDLIIFSSISGYVLHLISNQC